MKINIKQLKRVIKEELSKIITERRAQYGDNCWCLVCGTRAAMVEDMDGRVTFPFECENPQCSSHRFQEILSPEKQFQEFTEPSPEELKPNEVDWTSDW